MHLPDDEIERVALSMISEFGNAAEQEALRHANSSRERGFGPIALIWERVGVRIAHLQGGDDHEVPKAA